MAYSRPPSLLNGLLWGVGMGAGSEVGHAAVRSVTGGNKDHQVGQEETKGAPMAAQEQSTEMSQSQAKQQDLHPCYSLSQNFLSVIFRKD